jgi:hypothetical protein
MTQSHSEVKTEKGIPKVRIMTEVEFTKYVTDVKNKITAPDREAQTHFTRPEVFVMLVLGSREFAIQHPKANLTMRMGMKAIDDYDMGIRFLMVLDKKEDFGNSAELVPEIIKMGQLAIITNPIKSLKIHPQVH